MSTRRGVDGKPAGTRLPDPPTLLRDRATAELTAAIEWLRHSGRGRHRGIHEARKAMRRARAALLLARKQLGKAARLYERTIKLACRHLSALRDAQAVLDTFDRLCDERAVRADAEFILSVRRQLLRNRHKLLAGLFVQDPAFLRLSSALSEVRGAISTLSWQNVSTESIARAMARTLSRLKSAHRRARRLGGEAPRHRWRRRLRLRNHQRALIENIVAADRERVVDPLAPLATADAKAAKRADKAAQLLGEEHDLRVLREAVTQMSALPLLPRRNLLRAIGRALSEAIAKSR